MKMALRSFIGLVTALVIGAAIAIPAAAQWDAADSDAADAAKARQAGIYGLWAAKAGELGGSVGGDLRALLGPHQ
jgi:hypothetical protein